MDEVYRRKNGESLHQGVKHLFKEERPLERTPEWVEPIKKQKKAVADKSGDDLSKALFPLQVGSADSPSKFVPPQPKVKPKTRGTTQSTSDNTLEPAAGAPAEEDR